MLEKFLNDHDDMHDFNITANRDRENALHEERARSLQVATDAAGEDLLGEVRVWDGGWECPRRAWQSWQETQGELGHCGKNSRRAKQSRQEAQGG